MLFRSKNAFQTQIDGLGFSLVEVVSTCPTNWGLSPQEAREWLQENMLPYYQLGKYIDASEGLGDTAVVRKAQEAGEAAAAEAKEAEDGE